MNAQMKKDLESVVNSVINEDTDKAISSFKAYLKEKTKEILESGDFEGDRSRFEDDDEFADDEVSFKQGDLDDDGDHDLEDHELEADDADDFEFSTDDDDYSDGRY